MTKSNLAMKQLDSLCFIFVEKERVDNPTYMVFVCRDSWFWFRINKHGAWQIHMYKFLHSSFLYVQLCMPLFVFVPHPTCYSLAFMPMVKCLMEHIIQFLAIPENDSYVAKVVNICK